MYERKRERGEEKDERVRERDRNREGAIEREIVCVKKKERRTEKERER